MRMPPKGATVQLRLDLRTSGLAGSNSQRFPNPFVYLGPHVRHIGLVLSMHGQERPKCFFVHPLLAEDAVPSSGGNLALLRVPSRQMQIDLDPYEGLPVDRGLFPLRGMGAAASAQADGCEKSKRGHPERTQGVHGSRSVTDQLL